MVEYTWDDVIINPNSEEAKAYEIKKREKEKNNE